MSLFSQMCTRSWADVSGLFKSHVVWHRHCSIVASIQILNQLSKFCFLSVCLLLSPCPGCPSSWVRLGHLLQISVLHPAAVGCAGGAFDDSHCLTKINTLSTLWWHGVWSTRTCQFFQLTKLLHYAVSIHSFLTTVFNYLLTFFSSDGRGRSDNQSQKLFCFQQTLDWPCEMQNPGISWSCARVCQAFGVQCVWSDSNH